MKQLSGDAGRLWGPAILGYGRYTRNEKGTGDFCYLSFSPHGRTMTVHVPTGVKPYAPILARLGKHESRENSVHFRKLADLDASVLRELLSAVLADTRARYPV